MFENKDSFKEEFCQRVIQTYGRAVNKVDRSDQFLVLAQMVREYANFSWMKSKEEVASDEDKQLFYFSMEFLIGRLLTNNMMNLGIYSIIKEGLADLDIDLGVIENVEKDAGLGNGGLGRLAACFLDSLATLGLPGHGNSIRYEYGLFEQKIVDCKQVEVPDIWLKYGNPWEVRKTKHAVDVRFYGKVETFWNTDGNMDVKHVDAEVVKAVPYDVPVVGKGNVCVNNLRLWKPEASDKAPAGKDFIAYIEDVNKICQNVYPDDSTEEGRILRIKQEYFFVSAGVQTIMADHYAKYHTFDNLPDKVVIQLNDTHPVLVIPEIMRILMDDYRYRWDVAWDIVCRTVAYTNHTIMQEALEKWPEKHIATLLPRIYLIIKEINNRKKAEVYNRTLDPDLTNRVSIIKDSQVHMANLACHTVFSINGVARIHTEIIKNDVMKDFYYLYPEKFNSKTNGITHRRWLLYSNPQLTQLLVDKIGPGFIDDPQQLEKLMDFVEDDDAINRFMEVKRQRKQILADYIKKKLDIDIDINSIFDVQAKRLHAYKRQMLNCMNIIALYQRFKKEPGFTIYPRTFIFAAKAAPSYVYAKNVIELINRLAAVINNDPEVSRYMKVVFIPNYNVSIAEILMNAADISEQISTAGKEASGTGNMKLMMNGAITLGTLDGANVEIAELVGDDNIIVFGHNVDELRSLKYNGYDAKELYRNNEIIHDVLDSLVDGTWHENKDEFKPIFDEILYRNDEYFLLADFEQYSEAQRTVYHLYKERRQFCRMCLINIAKSGYFSSDRTISDYNRDIWHLKEIR